MSPRAAWRLEALGHTDIYDYVVGKSDWLAAGLPTEGDRSHPPRVAEAMDRSVPACPRDARIADLVTRLVRSRSPVCVVVNDHRVVQGRLHPDRLDPADHRTVEEVMDPGPTTVRADADLAESLDRMKIRRVTSLIVSTPEGILLGALLNERAKEPQP